MTTENLQWHPAFFAGLQIELKEDRDNLIFENEHQLGTKPKQIDVLVIKKEKDIPLTFVSIGYPQKLIKHLEKEWGCHLIKIMYREPSSVSFRRDTIDYELYDQDAKSS